MDLTELYQDLILDHGKKPRNFGKCNKFNHDAEGHNPLCGDNIHVYLSLDTDKKVKDISFEGSGCAISVASSSIMTEIVKGKSEKQARELLNAFFKMIKELRDIDISSLLECYHKLEPEIKWTEYGTRSKQSGIQYRIGGDPFSDAVGSAIIEDIIKSPWSENLINSLFKDTPFEEIIKEYDMRRNDNKRDGRG
jgi:nitrogen fixation NifU-like protein